MSRIKEKLEQIEDKVKTLEVADVTLHKLRAWFNPNRVMNSFSRWYFSVDEPINTRDYLGVEVMGIVEEVASLARGRIASREGSILEEKQAYEQLSNLPSDKVIEIIRETASKKTYNDSFSRISDFSIGCFQNFNIYLVSTRPSYGGYGIHIKGKRKVKNKHLNNLASRLHNSSLFNNLMKGALSN